MFKGIDTGTVSQASAENFNVARLKKTCHEFESIFLTHMLKTMRSAMVEDGYLGKSHERNMMNDLLDESLTQGVSQGGGVGIGKVMFEKLMAGHVQGSEKQPLNSNFLQR